MANTIKIKNSVTPSNAPSSLEFGELAINVADEKLFYKNSSNEIKSFNFQGSGQGDMTKSTYDTNDNGIVDNAELVNGHSVNQDLETTDDVSFNSVTTSEIQFTGGEGTQGTVTWNSDEETLDLVQNGTTLQLGQELQYHVTKHSSATDIANGDPVIAVGASGGASAKILVAKATVSEYNTCTGQSVTELPAKVVIGVATEAITTNGAVTAFGKVRDIDTSTYTVGLPLYLDTTNGTFTHTEPTSGISLPMAFPVNSVSSGAIQVRVTPIDENKYELADSTILKDADIGSTVQGYDANIVSDGSYVHTDNNYTTTEKNKLANIDDNANNYTLPSDVVQDASYVHTDNNYTTTEKNKLAGIEDNANNYSHPSSHPATMITTTDEFVYSNSSNVQDVLDDLDQALQGKQASGSYVTTTDNQALHNTDALRLSANQLYLYKGDGTSESVDLSLYLDDTNLARLVSGSLNGSTGIATFTRDDASTFTVDFSALFDDTNTNDYVDSISFNTGNGVLTLGRTGALADLTVDLDGRYAYSSHSHNYVSEGGTDFSGTYPMVARIGTNNIYSNPSLTYTGSTDTLNAVNIAVSGTVDGRDVSADGAKLDGIATGANNYTHPSTHPASMITTVDEFDNSNSTNVQDVLDDLDSAISGKQASGTYNTIIGTDSDINTSGSTIVDNIYVTDGVITSMGTRTLTLGDLGYTGETNATADQTPSEILTAIKTVDGSGSGLDADTVDGLEASQFARTDIAETFSSSVTATSFIGNGSQLTGINAGATISDTAPSSPSQGDMWFDSTIGNTYIYYNDGNTSQWVSATQAINGLDGLDGEGVIAGGSAGQALVKASSTDYDTTWASFLPISGGTMTGAINLGQYDVSNGSSIYMDNWYRSTGSTGWYSQTYSGGIYMVDTTWVRVYNSKAFYVANQIAATGNVTAYYSDMRLKDKTRDIDNALEKVCSLTGFYYTNNDLAKSFGYNEDKEQIALSAQDVKEVCPEVVSLAPFDMETKEDGEIVSKSGEDYMTIDYAKLVPLLVESIKELKAEIEELKKAK